MHPENPKYSPDSSDSTHARHTKIQNKLASIFSSALFYFSILFFIIGFNFSDVMVGNWYQQFMPSIGGRSITDVFFLDSLTGWAVTNATNQGTDTIYVLKTTNSGDSWSIHFRKTQIGGGFSGYFKVHFLNQNTGYTTDVRGVYKTTDGGLNWVSLNAPLNAYLDMSILNTDSIWIVSGNPLDGGVFRTTNGGASWQNQLNIGSLNPDHVYFYNGRIGFVSEVNGGAPYIRRTTDSGQSWSVVLSTEAFRDMYFTDSLTGWRAWSNNMYKTTDGGLNWITQTLPSGGMIITSGINKFSNINQDTIWGAGGYVGYPNFQVRGILYRTTNGGVTWRFQVPDTSIHIVQYSHIKFANKFYGWAYSGGPGIHTTNGGDTTFYLGIQQISTESPKDFSLKQNYPNPFNPRTVIPFSLKKTAYVKLIAYDITGREIQKMVDGNYSAGEYEVDFMGKFSASGVYLYRMEVIDGQSNKLYVETKKMLLIK